MPRITDLSDGAREAKAHARHHALPAQGASGPPNVPSGVPVKASIDWFRKLRLLNAVLSFEEPDSIDVSAGKFL